MKSTQAQQEFFLLKPSLSSLIVITIKRGLMNVSVSVCVGGIVN